MIKEVKLKQFTILGGWGDYQAVLVLTSTDDVIFNMPYVARELSRLSIEGAVLFDRFLITGNGKDRFSYNIIYNGEFLFEGLRVLKSPNEKEEIKKELSKFYKSVQAELEKELNIDISDAIQV